MRLRTRSLAGRAIAAAATLTVLVAPLAVTAGGAQADTQVRAAKPALKVMTRNLYLGTDIMRPIVAIQGKRRALELLTALANATDTARAIVDDTDFGTRAGLLAEEMATNKPDLVGLQEVALWRSGPLQLTQAAIPNATDVDYDFLAMLAQRAQGSAASPTARSASTGSPTSRHRRSAGRHRPPRTRGTCGSPCAT